VTSESVDANNVDGGKIEETATVDGENDPVVAVQAPDDGNKLLRNCLFRRPISRFEIL
jgi:hypothetical protein